MPLGAVRAALLGIKKGIQGILVGPNQIATSTASTATAYSNQRKIDRTSNGVLWSFHNPTTTTDFSNSYSYYSTDNGATWTYGGAVDNGSGASGTSYTRNFSVFIDQDDYCHYVMKDPSNGYIYYRRGTPNAGRTAWTWSAATQVSDTTAHDYPDVVAHRDGSGWQVHIVYSYMLSPSDGWYYRKIALASNGSVTLGSQTGLGLNYGNNVHKWPSIDFHHTGDGKTIKDGTPHLYVAWSAGATGSGKGIRFKKATYSGGTWTWGTEREIDSTRYFYDANYMSQCMFDGTRAIIVGQTATSGGASTDLMLYERDAADTTTTVRALGIQHNSMHTSSSYDSAGNIYIGCKFNNPQGVGYFKWTRATTTLGSFVLLGTVGPYPYVSAKRGYSNNRIEFIYTDGAASPYSIKYGGIT